MKVIVFSSSWCSKCSPFKEQLKKAGIEFESIDVDEKMEVANAYGVRGLPTTVIEATDGSEIFRTVGPNLKEVKEFLGES